MCGQSVPHRHRSGADLKRWSGDIRRRAVLEKTRAQLLSPQPQPTRIRKRYQENNDWEVGGLISYQTPHGKYSPYTRGAVIAPYW
jgi:hypothetical protein